MNYRLSLSLLFALFLFLGFLRRATAFVGGVRVSAILIVWSWGLAVATLCCVLCVCE
jgi:hypothetical protein